MVGRRVMKAGNAVDTSGDTHAAETIVGQEQR
jgi:hypothetical protein